MDQVRQSRRGNHGYVLRENVKHCLSSRPASLLIIAKTGRLRSHQRQLRAAAFVNLTSPFLVFNASCEERCPLMAFAHLHHAATSARGRHHDEDLHPQPSILRLATVSSSPIGFSMASGVLFMLRPVADVAVQD